MWTAFDVVTVDRRNFPSGWATGVLTTGAAAAAEEEEEEEEEVVVVVRVATGVCAAIIPGGGSMAACGVGGGGGGATTLVGTAGVVLIFFVDFNFPTTAGLKNCCRSTKINTGNPIEKKHLLRIERSRVSCQVNYHFQDDAILITPREQTNRRTQRRGGHVKATSIRCHRSNSNNKNCEKKYHGATALGCRSNVAG